MIVQDVIRLLDDWAPPGAAWDKDNPGLQVGNPHSEVQNILLALDASERVVEEAINRQCNLIITHHPLLFHSIKKIQTNGDTTSRIITALITHNITLLSYHTNLDFTPHGVNTVLAETLGLQNIKLLQPLAGKLRKLVVFIPITHINPVSEALFIAGAGKIGDYEKCSYRSTGTGTFLGNDASSPVIGSKLQFEQVEEIKLEVVFDEWNLGRILTALRESHPYEEPAYDIVPLQNAHTRYGLGAIGALAVPMEKKDFLEHVKKCLGLRAFRYAEGKDGIVQKVAVSGGSGNDMLQTALASGADALITADITYHTFQSAENRIFLLDAGHFETEVPVLKAVAQRLQLFVTERQSQTGVFESSYQTNPVKFYT